ncbi:hypothetical protein NHX12_018855 [Muraenolepis orangiensis]|uniref:C2H2 AKAP95-type domain-containing protein n=1 Tax=Muraenolepis orangiensis TaxID=630683 RepID=A0A9Q0F180_9TELE|nr:hypothetical protein NHX12_018855 [Muraenolepis orangiensis]
MLTAGEEPESRMNKAAWAEATEDTVGNNAEAGEEKTSLTETNPVADGEQDTSWQEDDSQAKASPQGTQTLGQVRGKPSNPKKRRGLLERSGAKIDTFRFTLACSVCKFRSFYKEDMAIHLQSRFHKHLKFLTSQLSKPITEFLQEYLQDKYEKTKQRISQFENHSATFCQVYREHDITREISMDHFIRKVDAAHCAACDMFIPIQPQLIQKDMKSAQHNFNRKGMLEQ